MAHLEKKDMKQTSRSSLVGFAVGDALGAPVKSLNRSGICMMNSLPPISPLILTTPANARSRITSLAGIPSNVA